MKFAYEGTYIITYLLLSHIQNNLVLSYLHWKLALKSREKKICLFSCPDYTGVLLYVFDDEDVVLHLATHKITTTCHSSQITKFSWRYQKGQGNRI